LLLWLLIRNVLLLRQILIAALQNSILRFTLFVVRAQRFVFSLSRFAISGLLAGMKLHFPTGSV